MGHCEDTVKEQEVAAEEEWRARVEELEKKVKECDKQLVEYKLVAREKAEKYERLVKALEERVECPICLEVPTTGPIYTCANGHCICSSCYQGVRSACSLCKIQMFKCFSIVATTIIENIEHVCKFDGCEERVAVDRMEEHRRVCGFRTVACPSFKCKKAVALNHVMDHVTNDCKFASTECCQMVATSTWSRTYEIPVENIVDRHIILDRQLEVFNWKDKFFFLDDIKEGRYRHFYVQMLASAKECLQYKATVTVTSESSACSMSFTDHPLSIDARDEDKTTAGLVAIDSTMKKVCRSPMDEKLGMSEYTVTLTFEEV